MTRSVHVFQVDAFTDRHFTGNPAGVVLGADVLATTKCSRSRASSTMPTRPSC